MLLWPLGNMSAWVAEQNIQRWAETGKIDEWYLASLPDDALPAIQESSLPPKMKSCVIANGYGIGSSTVNSFYGWNLARERGAKIRALHTPTDDCSKCR